MLNIAVIMGRLTAEPELKTTPNGVTVTSFTVAVNRIYKSGEEQKTDFIKCVAWRQTAEFITKYFHKGSMIAINGSIQQRSYTDKDGNKRTAFEIVADSVSFCGSKNESNSNTSDDVDIEVSDDFDEVDMSEDDLPF